MEQKIKHLEFIQNITSRMANNSFLLKGWCVTLIVAILGFSNFSFCAVFCVVFVFYILDTYFLYLEKLFRILYNSVRTDKANNFSLKIEQDFCVFLKSLFSISNILFYVLLIIFIFLFIS